MKELLFLCKECGFGDALFYFFYKIDLKVQYFPYIKRAKKKRFDRIEKIYAALSLLQFQTDIIDGKKLNKINQYG